MATKKEVKFITVLDELTGRVISTVRPNGTSTELEKGFKVIVSDTEPDYVNDDITGSKYIPKEK